MKVFFGEEKREGWGVWGGFGGWLGCFFFWGEEGGRREFRVVKMQHHAGCSRRKLRAPNGVDKGPGSPREAQQPERWNELPGSRPGERESLTSPASASLAIVRRPSCRRLMFIASGACTRVWSSGLLTFGKVKWVNGRKKLQNGQNS